MLASQKAVVRWPMSELKSIRDLPGPRALPLVGNLLQISPEKLHLTFEAWAEQYGPIYQFRAGKTSGVVVSDPTQIREVLKRRPGRYRRANSLEKVFNELGLNFLFTLEGESWRRQRGLINAAFTPRTVRALFPELRKVAKRLCARWATAAADNEIVDLDIELRSFAVDITTIVAFGVDVNTVERGPAALREHLKHLLPIVNRRIMAPIPYWRWFELPSDRALTRGLAAVRAKVGELIEQAHARLQSDPERVPQNLLEAMIGARDDEQPQARLTDDEVFGNTIGLLVAGEDTTSNTAAWILYYLASQPPLMQRLREELERELGEDTMLPDPESRTRLPYLEGLIQEALRLRSPAPFTFLENLADEEIMGVHVPAGSLVVALLRMPGLQSQYFHEPRRFDPERWIAETRNEEVSHDPRAAFAFGFGPRLCPGRALALLELALLTSMVALNYDIELVDGPELQEVFGFTMSPEKVRLRVYARKLGDGPTGS